MRNLRALVRLAPLLVLNATLFPVGLATRLPRLFGRADTALRWGVRVQCLWARANLRLAGVRVRVEGEPGGGRELVVANHCSYLDILVLGARFPGRFVAKSEIARWPAIGPLARSVGTIFVDQGRARDVLRVGAEMQRTLAAGVPVLLFPEGGAQSGARLQGFRTALFAGPAHEGVPCRAVALHYATPGVPWGAAWTACWWGGMGLARHVWRLLGTPGGVVATVRPSGDVVRSGDRRELALRLHAALEERFLPIGQEPAPPDNPWPELEAECRDPAASTVAARDSYERATSADGADRRP